MAKDSQKNKCQRIGIPRFTFHGTEQLVRYGRCEREKEAVWSGPGRQYAHINVKPIVSPAEERAHLMEGLRLLAQLWSQIRKACLRLRA
jgi:hypothetical protein